MKNNGFDRLRQLGRAEFIGAVMTDQQVLHQQRQLCREIRNRGNLLVDQLDFHDQMAQELARVGVIDRSLKGKLVDFADVVQKAAYQQEIDVDAAIVLDDFEDQLEQRERMLEQTA